MTTETDMRHLERALELAALGGNQVSPNPHVGAVLARDGKVLGEGYHHEIGGPHAEVEAILDAGDQDLAGATIYVSLEPCAHHGRTPPCTDAIIEAGVARVVVGIEDPDARVAGRGDRFNSARERVWRIQSADRRHHGQSNGGTPHKQLTLSTMPPEGEEIDESHLSHSRRK